MSTGSFVTADGCHLSFEVEGTGSPVLWQHGLGATTAQPAEVFPADLGQRITLACRGHADSELGDPASLTIAQFATDAVGLLDHLGIASATVGGISLGAAIALRLGARHPDRVSSLVLARPAWVVEPAPPTQAAYLEVARHLRDWGATEGRKRFRQTETYRFLSQAAPDNAATVMALFSRPRPDTTIALLSCLPTDGPGIGRTELTELAQRTLIIVTPDDHVHLASYGHELGSLVPNAQVVEITSKACDRNRYVTDFRKQLADFLLEERPR